MKRFITFFSTGFIIVTALMMPAMASAQLTPAGTGLTAAAEGSGLATGCSGTECLAQIVGRVINVALGFLGIVLLAILIYAGFTWMTAGGEVEKVKRAKSMLVNAVAGIVVIAASFAITSFVVSQLGSVAGGGGSTTEGGDSAACASFDCSGSAAFCTTAGMAGCEDYDRCCR